MTNSVKDKMKFEFGDKVKDTITGFEGTVVAKIQYIFGCTQYQVQPLAKDGEQKKADWIDEQQLKLIKRPGEKPKKNTKKPAGGIRPKP